MVRVVWNGLTGVDDKPWNDTVYNKPRCGFKRKTVHKKWKDDNIETE